MSVATTAMTSSTSTTALLTRIRPSARCSPRSLRSGNSIAQQLNFGVRFLDVRCYHSNDLFYIYHGIVDENQTFSQVLAQVFDFLNTNSTECVIMSVKKKKKTHPSIL